MSWVFWNLGYCRMPYCELVYILSEFPYKNIKLLKNVSIKSNADKSKPQSWLNSVNRTNFWDINWVISLGSSLKLFFCLFERNFSLTWAICIYAAAILLTRRKRKREVCTCDWTIKINTHQVGYYWIIVVVVFFFFFILDIVADITQLDFLNV